MSNLVDVVMGEVYLGELDLENLIEQRIERELQSINSDLPADNKRNMITRHRYERTGETRLNNQGLEMTIIDYLSSSEVYVQFFKTNSVVRTTYHSFQSGKVKDLMSPSVFGQGCIGVGKYKTVENGITTQAYRTWMHMLERVFSPKYLASRPSYKEVRIDDRFLCFQYFNEWYDKNYYEIEGETMCLDKDILSKDGKIYSPNTCCFVPMTINNLFIKRNASRGGYPIGMSLNKQINKLQVFCSDADKKNKFLGYFNVDDIEAAFETYKEFKQSVIQEIAESYKGRIPRKVYDALVNYEVTIND